MCQKETGNLSQQRKKIIKYYESFYTSLYERVFRKKQPSSSKKGLGFIFFKRFPGFCRWLDIHDPQSFVAQILEWCGVTEGRKLLDVSCGGGALLAATEAKGLSTYGVDISWEALRFSKRSTNQTLFALANAEKLPFNDDIFDYICCIGSLEHYLDPLSALCEMLRVSTEGATFCILVPNAYYIGVLKHNIFRHEGDYVQITDQVFEKVRTTKQWREMIKKSGFRVLGVRKDNHCWVIPTLSWKDVLLSIFHKLLPVTLSRQVVFICRKA